MMGATPTGNLDDAINTAHTPAPLGGVATQIVEADEEKIKRATRASSTLDSQIPWSGPSDAPFAPGKEHFKAGHLDKEDLQSYIDVWGETPTLQTKGAPSKPRYWEAKLNAA